MVVFKLDRISRKLADGIQVLCDWLEGGIRVVTVDGHDFKGATGKFIASVLFSVSEMEQHNRRERQAIGIANAKANGVYIGRKPGSTKAKPSKAKQLKERGFSVIEIAKQLGVKRATVYRYLSA